MQLPFFQFIVFNIEQKESGVISFRFYNDSLTKKLIISHRASLDYVHTALLAILYAQMYLS